MLFKKEYHIDWGDIDLKKELKLSTLFSLFQDASSDASEELGFSIDRLENEFGLAWVLMKMRVDMIRNPKQSEVITIETWPLEPTRLSFDRDFLVKDSNGNVIIKAISTWVIMDLRERKIDRYNRAGINYSAPNNERAIDAKLSRLKAKGPLEIAYKKMIGYSDIDFNGHLNNAKYIDYIMDCFDISEHKKFKTKSIEVHFTNEALPGEEIILQKDISEVATSGIYIEGIKSKTNEAVFKARVIVSKS